MLHKEFPCKSCGTRIKKKYIHFHLEGGSHHQRWEKFLFFNPSLKKWLKKKKKMDICHPSADKMSYWKKVIRWKMSHLFTSGKWGLGVNFVPKKREIFPTSNVRKHVKKI